MTHCLPTPSSVPQKQINAVKSTGLPLSPSAAGQWAGFLDRPQDQRFSSWLQPPAGKAKLQTSTSEKWGLPSYARALLMGWKLHSATEMTALAAVRPT